MNTWIFITSIKQPRKRTKRNQTKSIKRSIDYSKEKERKNLQRLLDATNISTPNQCNKNFQLKITNLFTSAANGKTTQNQSNQPSNSVCLVTLSLNLNFEPSSHLR